MNNESREILFKNYSAVQDTDKLQNILKHVQHIGQSTLQSSERRLKDQYYGLSSSGNQQWIIAEQDYPEEQSLVVLFDDREVKVTKAKNLIGIAFICALKHAHAKTNRASSDSIENAFAMARDCLCSHQECSLNMSGL
jgi:hypothetical protein